MHCVRKGDFPWFFYSAFSLGATTFSDDTKTQSSLVVFTGDSCGEFVATSITFYDDSSDCSTDVTSQSSGISITPNRCHLGTPSGSALCVHSVGFLVSFAESSQLFVLVVLLGRGHDAAAGRLDEEDCRPRRR